MTEKLYHLDCGIILEIFQESAVYQYRNHGLSVREMVLKVFEKIQESDGDAIGIKGKYQ
ncbi:hypothetical protein [Blautia hydrogenotrophica]|nr:hypothetical protein [Blautia hydrogenotrophica]